VLPKESSLSLHGFIFKERPMPKIVFPPAKKLNPPCVTVGDGLEVEFRAPGNFAHSECDKDFNSPIPKGRYPDATAGNPTTIGPFTAIGEDPDIEFYFLADDGNLYLHTFKIQKKCKP
jgi:hypothetical protein